MFDGHEVPLQRRSWELHVVPLFKEILRELDVVKEQLCVHDDGPDNAAYDLQGVRLLVACRMGDSTPGGPVAWTDRGCTPPQTV